MPELPEVETIVQQLSASLVGQCLTATHIGWPGVVATPSPDALAAALQGRTITGVRRRGKFILIDVPPQVLVVHLRMTGRLYLCDPTGPAPADERYVRAWWSLSSGQTLCFADLRKFGRLYLVDDPAPLVAGLGPEPLADDLSAERFATLLKAHRRQLKPLLLDQHLVAGLGNIYTDEALWRARLHPLTRADALTPAQAEELWAAIRATLCEAIADGGTTLRDYRNARNEAGSHAPALAVYGRAGAPCPRCGAPIVRLVVGGRGTHICPICQPFAPHSEGA